MRKEAHYQDPAGGAAGLVESGSGACLQNSEQAVANRERFLLGLSPITRGPHKRIGSSHSRTVTGQQIFFVVVDGSGILPDVADAENASRQLLELTGLDRPEESPADLGLCFHPLQRETFPLPNPFQFGNHLPPGWSCHSVHVQYSLAVTLRRGYYSLPARTANAITKRPPGCKSPKRGHEIKVVAPAVSSLALCIHQPGNPAPTRSTSVPAAPATLKPSDTLPCVGLSGTGVCARAARALQRSAHWRIYSLVVGDGQRPTPIGQRGAHYSRRKLHGRQAGIGARAAP